MIPIDPPKKGKYLKTDATMKFKPIVAKTRKSLFTRRLGRPRKTPTSMVMTTTKGRAAQKLKP